MPFLITMSARHGGCGVHRALRSHRWRALRLEMRGDDNLSPSPPVPAYMEIGIDPQPSPLDPVTTNHPHPPPHKLLPSPSPLPYVTACPHLFPSPLSSNIAETCQSTENATLLNRAKFSKWCSVGICHKKGTWWQC